MHLTVFGATGGTGTQFVHQALAAGHHVTAVVRDPSRLVLPSDPDSLEIRRAAAPRDATVVSVPGSAAGVAVHRADAPHPGDATVGADVGDASSHSSSLGASGSARRLTVVVADVMDPQAVEGAVAGADAVVSAMGHRGRGPTTVCEDSIASVLRAARAGGTSRIVMVSAAGMIVDSGDGPVTRYLVKPILGRVLRDAFTDMRAAEARLWDNELDWTIVRPPMLTDKPWTGTYRVSLDRNLRGGRSIARADLADYLLRAIPDTTTVRHSVAVAY